MCHRIPSKHKATLNFKFNDFLLLLTSSHHTQHTKSQRSRKEHTEKINIRETSQATAGWIGLLACACVVVLLSALLSSLRLHKTEQQKTSLHRIPSFFRSRNTSRTEPVNLFVSGRNTCKAATLNWRCVGSGDRVTETVRVSRRTK